MKPPAQSSSSRSSDVWIFANPISGKGQGRVIAQRLERSLSADGFRPRLFVEIASAISDRVLSEPARAAIVIGGDGTLRAVADRFIAQIAPPPILPIGLGTANLMVRHLGLKWDRTNLESEVTNAISNLRVRELDAGRANGRLFLLMVGIGFDAQIVHELDRMRSGPIGWLSYVPPAALALHEFSPQPMQVVVDGEEVWPMAPALAFVGNVREYGVGFPVLPFATPDDGLFDICVLPCESRAQLIRLFLHAVAGEHLVGHGSVYLRGKHVQISGSQSIPAQIDGDPGGHTPVEINLLPFRVPFIVR
ncbi:MAG TPA: diacylglycerol kinase family protein [Tepidisphaeraceae bacterium]|nr:diacylglycerol kinase family protein [Tepidisphaeraceae bacterium]